MTRMTENLHSLLNCSCLAPPSGELYADKPLLSNGSVKCVFSISDRQPLPGEHQRMWIQSLSE